MDIPIVIAAYNRPASLSRLLASLQKAQYTNTVQLIISIDGGGDKGVLKTAEAFQWPFGEKEIIHHKENLGLRRHILSCGDLSRDYDGIILLEDDLYVSPQFYNYAQQAMPYYREDDAIAGIALYAHGFNETASFPFYPFLDGSDVFFMQLACSWGQCWTKNQWTLFRQWINEKGESSSFNHPGLPGDIALWPETSWKKYFILYMIEKNLFFVYPRQSYTTNFGDKGQHQDSVKNFQMPLQYGQKTPAFVKLEDSCALYDAFCEMIPACLNKMAPELNQYDYCVDLYGIKMISAIDNEFVLTAKQNRQPLLSFGKRMLPLEANIIERIEGNRLFLTKTTNCRRMDSYIKQKKMLWNISEDILYHYKLPVRYVEKLNNDPARFVRALFKNLKKKTRKWD